MFRGDLVKKTMIFIAFFIAICVLTCVGVVNEKPIWACIGAISSAILGYLISIILTAIDAHEQGLLLWFQHIKFWNKDIRLSFSYLFRIQINGKYLLVKGNRLKNQYQPIGGVYKYYDEAKPVLESFCYRPDVRMGNSNETDDLRIYIKGKHLLSYMQWFKLMKNREYDPLREFREELINSKLLPAEIFENIEYRKVLVHNKGVQFSTYMQCNELVYADVFEIKLSAKQKSAILNAVQEHSDMLCLATDNELLSECYNGIEKNLGNNAKWLLGE